MKNYNYDLADLVALVIFFSSITIDVFFNFIISYLNAILLANNFASSYNFIKFLTENTIIICKIPWLNNLIFILIGFIPSMILKQILKETSIPNLLNNVLCIALYYLVLQLFSSIVFWIVITILLAFYITHKLINFIINKRRKYELQYSKK